MFKTGSCELSLRLVVLSGLVLALVSVERCAGQAMPIEESMNADVTPFALRTLITGTCTEVHRYVESIVGRNVIDSSAECVKMLIHFLAEGVASGLNVIAVYVTEILRATGVDATLPFPHVTPEGVASVTQWALLALIGHWLLSVLLRVLVAVGRQVFWLLKTVGLVWAFGLIVRDEAVAGAEVTALRLVGLTVAWALLGLLDPSSPPSEQRMASLEGRVKALERRRKEG